MAKENQLFTTEYKKYYFELSDWLGYGADILLVDSCRNVGKSFQADRLPRNQFKKYHYTTIFLKRRPVDITTGYILGLRDELNKFRDENDKIDFYFRDGDRKEGIVDVYITKEDFKTKSNVFIRILALNIGADRIKNSKLQACKYVVFDEYKIDARRINQKYLNGEYDLFKEFYYTYVRFAPEGLKCIFLGNAYSDYSPYQEGLKIDTNQIKLGCILTGKAGRFNYVYTKYKPSQELIEKLIGNDPDILKDKYERFAILGEAVNDSNILTYDHLPAHFTLRYVIKSQGKTLGVYKYDNSGRTEENVNFAYYVQEIEWKAEYKRQIFCFEIQDLADGTIMPTRELISYLAPIRVALQFRNMAFKNIGDYYTLEYLYTFIPDRI